MWSAGLIGQASGLLVCGQGPFFLYPPHLALCRMWPVLGHSWCMPERAAEWWCAGKLEDVRVPFVAQESAVDTHGLIALHIARVIFRSKRNANFTKTTLNNT